MNIDYILQLIFIEDLYHNWLNLLLLFLLIIEIWILSEYSHGLSLSMTANIWNYFTAWINI